MEGNDASLVVGADRIGQLVAEELLERTGGLLTDDLPSAGATREGQQGSQGKEEGSEGSHGCGRIPTTGDGPAGGLRSLQ